MIDHWHGCSFDWPAWHGGSLLNLGVQYNSYHVRHMAHKIRQYAIAWCRGDQVICRPKPGRVAVMFLKDDFQFWTHLLDHEFDLCFPNIRKDAAAGRAGVYRREPLSRPRRA